MPSAELSPTTTTSRSVRKRTLRLGFLPLTDAAPLVAAKELGIFSRRGLRVELTREVGWATIRDKVIYGEIEAAPAPAPMLWDAELGINSARGPVLTALVLNLHGNAITLSNALRSEGAVDAASLRKVVRARQGERRVTFGVVFPFSSHHLLLRSWLRSAGIQPDTDLRIVMVPPAQMFRNLVAGTIDGFCAGEPWNSLAVQEKAGWCPTWSAALAPGHIEKVLMVSQVFAEERATEHAMLIAALHEACAWCDQPHNRERLAEMLSAPNYLNLSTALITPALKGRFDCGHGDIANAPDFHVFHRGEANAPLVAKAAALQQELVSAGLLPANNDPSLPRRLFREDLYREALAQHQSTHETVS
jgi:ABC-type nitrate/sulfonate/bicarbonate transport system substrate-binding protein